jgi:hypothetical protein
MQKSCAQSYHTSIGASTLVSGIGWGGILLTFGVFRLTIGAGDDSLLIGDATVSPGLGAENAGLASSETRL